MEKNQNVDILIGKIISNEKLIHEFSKLDSLDQIYDFCQTIHSGYTKEEFALYINEILSSFIKESSIDISSIEGIKDDDIETISGGAKLDIKRVMAAGLASLIFTSASGINGVCAADTNKVNNVAVVQQEKQEESGTFSRIWSGVKAKLSSLKNMIARNKGKLTVGALILAIIGAGIWKKDTIKQKWNNLDWVVDRNRRQRTKDILKDRIKTNKELIDSYARDYDEAPEVRVGNDDRLTKGEISQQLTTLSEENRTIEANIQKLDSDSRVHWYSGIPVLAQFIATGGLAVTGAKTIWDLMNNSVRAVGTFSKSITDINNAKYSINSMVQELQYSLDLMNENNNKQEFNREEARKKLEEGLETVRGQERAKKGVRGFFNSVTMEKERLKAIEKKDTHAHVVVFNGASGTGKSFTAGHLASAISNASPYIMSASEVDVNSSKSSIVGQLFGDNGGYYYGYGGQQQERKNFVKYIEDHPNDGVVIINEYDKMCVRDSKDHPLDEVMRTFIDEGKATINGKIIDCSGIVFILTTNESDGSLQGKVYVDPVTGKLVDPTAELDSTGSRTIVKHDKSFLNRLTIVSFDNLSAQEYSQIARDKFAPTIDFLKTDEGGNIELVISDESYNKIAKYMERINEGARTIEKILGELFTAVVEKVSELQDKGEEYLGRKLEAVYDDQKNEFIIH